MNLLPFLSKSDRVWDVLIAVSAFTALTLNLLGLLNGIFVALPHLLYIPVVLAAYRYPKWGLLIAGCIGGTYFLMVVLVAGDSFSTIIEALVRTFVLIGIGWLIAFLSFRLRERQDLYQGLFYHSEAGSILVRDTPQGRVVEEVNDKASELLCRKAQDLTGNPLTVFWSSDAEQEFFSQIGREGAVHAVETVFLLPDESSETVLVSAALLPEKRVIITFVEITRRVFAEKALKAANDKLKLLSRISHDHLHRTVDQMVQTVKNADEHGIDTVARDFFNQLRVLALHLKQQLSSLSPIKISGSPLRPGWESSRFLNLQFFPLPLDLFLQGSGLKDSRFMPILSFRTSSFTLQATLSAMGLPLKTLSSRIMKSRKGSISSWKMMVSGSRQIKNRAYSTTMKRGTPELDYSSAGRSSGLRA